MIQSKKVEEALQAACDAVAVLLLSKIIFSEPPSKDTTLRATASQVKQMDEDGFIVSLKSQQAEGSKQLLKEDKA